MAFPTSPANGQEYKNYKYDASSESWKKFNPKTQWAYKSAPTAYIGVGINSWNNGGGEGDSFDSTSSANGITILKDGLYEIRAVQRSNGTNTYINVCLNGNRAALETKADSLWNHDHATDNGSYSESNFIGYLNSGDFITAGPTVSTLSAHLSYSIYSYSGSIKIKRLK